jgi:hypothetical protein
VLEELDNDELVERKLSGRLSHLKDNVKWDNVRTTVAQGVPQNANIYQEKWKAADKSNTL